MFCIHCGANLPDNAQFCHNCGKPVGPAVSQGGAPSQKTAPADTANAPQPQPQPAPEAAPRSAPLPPQVPPAGPPQRPYPGPGPRQPPSIPQKPKWLIPLIACGAVVVLILMVVVFRSIFLKTKDILESSAVPQSSETRSSTPSTSGEQEAGTFLHYENSTVRFAFDYPEAFTYDEPNANNVILGAGEECRVAVEYAFQTTKNCFIYSSEDLVRQIEADPTVLSGYVGAEGVSVQEESTEQVNGQPCYLYRWTLAQNGKNYTGALYVLDSQGEFGCYTFMWVVENSAKDAERYRGQIEKMLESFQITGPYEAEGYTIYEMEDPDYLRFALRDELVQGEMELGYQGSFRALDNNLTIKPAAEGRSHISMYKTSTQRPYADREKDGFTKTMETAISPYFSDADYQNARLLSELTQLEIGRYPYVELDLTCHYSGYRADEEWMVYEFVFPQGGHYWNLTMIATDETLEQTSQVLVDLLISLQVENDTLSLGENAFGSFEDFDASKFQEAPAAQADKNQVINKLLAQIEGTPGFVRPDDYYQPLASFTDIDGNGVNELLCVYKVKKGNDFQALYDVYSVNGDGTCITVVSGQLLYQEVGGNSGTLGLALDAASKPYLVVETRTPQGDRFNNTYTYIPWNSSQSELEDSWVYLESHGVYGEESNGEYVIGDTKTTKADFDARRADFENHWTDLDLNKGPGNGGNNMSFEQIRTLDMNNYTFYSAK